MFESVLRVMEKGMSVRMDGVLPSVYGARRDSYKEEVSGMRMIKGMHAAREKNEVEVNQMDLLYWCCACCDSDRVDCPATVVLSIESEPIAKVISHNLWDVLFPLFHTKPPCLEEMWGSGVGKRIVVAIRVEEGVTSYAAVAEDLGKGEETWCDRGQMKDGIDEGIDVQLLCAYSEMIRSCAVVVDTRTPCFEAVLKNSASTVRLKNLYVASESQKKEIASLTSLLATERERADSATKEAEEKGELVASLSTQKKDVSRKLAAARWRGLAQKKEKVLKREAAREEKEEFRKIERKKKEERAESSLRRFSSLLLHKEAHSRRVSSLLFLLRPLPSPSFRFARVVKAYRLRVAGRDLVRERKRKASETEWKRMASRVSARKKGEETREPARQPRVGKGEGTWKRFAACLEWKERAASCVRYAREVTRSAIQSEAKKQMEESIREKVVDSIRDKVVKEVRSSLKDLEGARGEKEERKKKAWKGTRDRPSFHPPLPPQDQYRPDYFQTPFHPGLHPQPQTQNQYDYSQGVYCSIPESHRRA